MNLIELSSVEKMSDDELMRNLTEGIRLTAEVLCRLSLVWAELERRGKDLSHLRKGLMSYIPIIASGEIIPEAVVMYAKRPKIIESLRGVPIQTQRDLILNEKKISTVIIQPNGKPETVEFTLQSLPNHLIKQVFSDGRIIDVSEQKTMILTKNRKTVKKEKAVLKAKISIDTRSSTMKVGAYQVSVPEVVKAISDNYSVSPIQDILDENYETATVKLTKEEKIKLKFKEKQLGMDEWKIIRHALKTLGLI